MSITKILLKEWSQEQEDELRNQWGFTPVDIQKIDNYELVLLKRTSNFDIGNINTDYQIGLQKDGYEFSKMSDFMGKIKNEDGKLDVSSFRKMNKVIRQWVNKYGAIAIGSHDRRKGDVYQRIFSKLDYNTTVKYFMGMPILVIS